MLDVLRPDAELTSARDVLAGIQEHLVPAGSHLSFLSAAWSAPLQGDYETLRKGLALRSTPATFPDGIELDDCAVLITFALEEPRADVALEYGVVTAEELANRVSDPHMGMLGPRSMRPETMAPAVETLPPVSVFANFTISTASLTELTATVDVAERILHRLDSVMLSVRDSVEELATPEEG
ncbi:hypothetical protein GCM10009817_39700 [Terrabacter lapilli]|uniref:Uncharacterized protein n=1 Tax=Terrabacter lapilli TaxID=436231 RepID=A0ABN2SVW2_9MICO